jgi:metal-responsive CopG/Arc/MetJ family transcriptional regulator
MARVQISLGAADLELLDRVARATGVSRSALIRHAIRHTFGGLRLTKAEKLRALTASAGSWAGRDFTGAEYVDALRN